MPEREIVREFEVELPLADCERWCRSAESRMCFPGTTDVASEGSGLILMYTVQLSAPGTSRPAVLSVEEHLTNPDREEDGVAFTSTQVWHWPSGAVASAWATYQFSPAGERRTRVRLTQRYRMPGAALQEVLDERRFRQSTERAFDAYVEELRERPVRTAAPG